MEGQPNRKIVPLNIQILKQPMYVQYNVHTFYFLAFSILRMLEAFSIKRNVNWFMFGHSQMVRLARYAQ